MSDPVVIQSSQPTVSIDQQTGILVVQGNGSGVKYVHGPMGPSGISVAEAYSDSEQAAFVAAGYTVVIRMDLLGYSPPFDHSVPTPPMSTITFSNFGASADADSLLAISVVTTTLWTPSATINFSNFN